MLYDPRWDRRSPRNRPQREPPENPFLPYCPPAFYGGYLAAVYTGDAWLMALPVIIVVAAVTWRVP